MNKNLLCSCKEILEKNDSILISFSNESFIIYGNLNKSEEIIIKYKGKLITDINLDNTEIFLNYGYGNLWIDKDIKKMNLCSHSDELCFCTSLKLQHADNLFFCVMDSNNNWDLNNTSSYSVKIEEPINMMTKKIDAVVLSDDEYLTKSERFFICIKNKLIKFFERIGDFFYDINDV